MMDWGMSSGVAVLLALVTMTACTNASKPQPSSTTPAPLAASDRPAAVQTGGSHGAQTVPGSYLVQSSEEGEAGVRRVFAQYGVLMLTLVGKDLYEVRLERDPGLEVLSGLVSGSKGAVKSIQPNFVYRAY